MTTQQRLDELEPAQGSYALEPTLREIRLHLDRVLASDEFRTSRRSSDFLRHLVERALSDDIDSLKERLLGMEIFHRPSDYDTGSDAIVRVTANDVRKRLSNFYDRHPDLPIRICLPLGAYLPEFNRPKPAEVRAAQTAQEEAISPQEAAHGAAETPNLSGPPDAIKDKQPHEVHPAARRRSSLRMAALILAVALASLTAGWRASTLAHRHPAPVGAEDYSFYNQLLGPIGADPRQQTSIVLSNPHVLLYRGSDTAQAVYDDPLLTLPVPQDLVPKLNGSANDGEANFPFHFFQADPWNYTGLGEAQAAFDLEKVLEATNRSAHLTQARFLNWDSARRQQLVILGSPLMSAFAQGTLSLTNFTMEHDAIRNNHPLPGEQPFYRRRFSANALEDYGLIWMTKSPSGSRVLVLAGLTSAGTAGVGDFFTDPSRMRAVYDRLKAGGKQGAFPESWQVLLRINAREDVPVKVTVLSIRILNGD